MSEKMILGRKWRISSRDIRQFSSYPSKKWEFHFWLCSSHMQIFEFREHTFKFFCVWKTFILLSLHYKHVSLFFERLSLEIFPLIFFDGIDEGRHRTWFDLRTFLIPFTLRIRKAVEDFPILHGYFQSLMDFWEIHYIDQKFCSLPVLT